MIEALAGITDEPPGLTRTFLSAGAARARTLVAGWMHEAGLEVFEDAVGNLIGRRSCRLAGAPVVASGSHLDTVRNAGRFDGAMGIVVALRAAAAVRDVELPYHLEVVAFSDEEGVRFQSTYLGSRFYAGDGSVTTMAVRDAGGISIAEAVAGHEPEFPPPPSRRLAAYVEAHIEQGPVLENENRALGVVTGISGQTRLRITVCGVTGHAGTVPMRLRRDALAGAAEIVVAIESLARATEGSVATVGCLEIDRAASNVIPGLVTFSVDIRDADDDRRARLVGAVRKRIATVCAGRGLRSDEELLLEAPAVPCDPAIGEHLSDLVAEQEGLCPQMVSGAGHDAAAMAGVARVGMLFVRCRGGVSHHPDEFAAADDIECAIDVLTRFFREFQP